MRKSQDVMEQFQLNLDDKYLTISTLKDEIKSVKNENSRIMADLKASIEKVLWKIEFTP